jgi:hypothetical protein
VFQELSVDFQQSLVCAEDIIDRFNSLSFLFKKGMNECFKKGAVLQANRFILKEELDFGGCRHYFKNRKENRTIKGRFAG